MTGDENLWEALGFQTKQLMNVCAPFVIVQSLYDLFVVGTIQTL